MRKLLGNRMMLLRLIGKRGDITEGATATPDGTVAVRAAKTAMKRQLMNLLPIPT
ncbi:hypothetical protein SEEH8440_20681 [Salmonella enterica subsp. enterica serovar Heidelberg str. N18440]|nr:hypothetical protein SEEH8440_20681 [Salmonella enterica subsp. enterica serovar Heidelberg str. N18440]